MPEASVAEPIVAEPSVAGASIARVLIDSPLPQLDRLFDYRVPPALLADARPGVRVKVPLRSAGRVTDGYIIELVSDDVVRAAGYTGVLSEVESIVSPIPVLTAEVWAVARRASERAAGNAIDIVRLAVPTRQVRVEKQYLAAAPSVMAVETAEVGGESGATDTVVTTAEAHELPPLLPIAGYTGLAAALAAHQRVAVDAIPLVADVSTASTHGFGSTTVGEWAITLAQAAAATLARGESAILSVPDYRDQWQLEAALADVLPAESVVHLDARQSNPDRYRSFLRCLGPEPLVIVGNRSVVYAPAPHLGLIAVWDDGDPLHSEPLSPYVHARDAALVRQELEHCALMVIGHSRSTEVERLVEIGWFTSFAPTPSILPKVIPTAQQAAQDRLAAQARIPSSAWKAARAALDDGPVLVQVARPGYAPRLACVDCRQNARCQRCEGPLAQRSATSPPACLWCGRLAANWTCSNCGGEKLRLVGNGATRTAEDLGRAFPGIRIIIADGERQVLAVGPEPALVVATRGAEPVATGGYRAVLLLDGESMVARESLRVGEDCLRWWSNAAALAARRAPIVLVGVGGALATAMATWRQADYARSELVDRRALRFPPAIRVATVTGPIQAVAEAIATVPVEPGDILGPVEIGDGAVRSIVRFDYAHGADVAGGLRAEVIRSATARRASFGKGKAGPIKPLLKVRLDDVEPFLES